MLFYLFYIFCASAEAKRRYSRTRFQPQCSSPVSKMQLWNLSECHMQGRRSHMEDRYLWAEYPDIGAELYLVLDGHGGDKVADLTKDHFGDFFHRKTEGIFELSLLDMKKRIVDVFYEWDFKLPEVNFGERLYSGSTVTGVLVNSTSIIVLNAGDSQTLLMKDNSVVFSSKLHKPNDPIESARIRAAGGWVGGWDIPRVNGRLALSRAFGDFDFKNSKINYEPVGIREQAVIPEPDITIFSIDDVDSIFIASDGIYDALRKDEILSEISAGKVNGQSDEETVSAILARAFRQYSTDNMSALYLT